MSVAAANRLVATVGAANRWRDSHNPLRNLSMPRAVSLMEEAQRGVMADLQWLYGCETGVEATDPDLFVIIDRIQSALIDFEWGVSQVSDETRAFDASLADAQEAALREHYESCRNLYEAIAHLSLARFRGYAHVNPRFDSAGKLTRLEPLDQWNFARDGYNGAWHWNPDARQCEARSLPTDSKLDPRDYILVDTRRPVNRIGLIKYVRATTSEKDWDSYVETFGLPGAFIIMPSQIPAGQEAAYRDAAEDAAKGGSGALPAGSTVTVPGEGSRSSQPFQPRLEWLEKQLVLAGTGGLLTVLAESGSGTLAGSVHEQAFRQLARGVARRISESFQNQFDLPRLAEAFPGKPVLAYFDLKAKEIPNTSEEVKNAVALGAVFDLDPAEVALKTGFTIMGQKAVVAAAAPVAPTGTPTKQTDAASAGDVQSAALNGAQVQSLQLIISDVAKRQLPPSAAVEMIVSAFPLLPRDRVQQMVDAAAAFTPTPELPARAAARGSRTSDLGSPTSEDQLRDEAASLYAQAFAADFKTLSNRLAAVLQSPNLAGMQKELAALRADLPDLAEDILANPAGADVLDRAMTASLFNGLTQGNQA